MKFKWNPAFYDEKHDFVSAFGQQVVDLLNPQKGEKILDIGCGTGELTNEIAGKCKKVIGLDNSEDMIQTAKQKYPELEFLCADAKDFKLDLIFDAVFSNAVLHWLPEAEKVILTINAHLKTGGRFVAEFGGKGCVKKIISALTRILEQQKIAYPDIANTLYYPSIADYSVLLERNGFEVNYAVLFDRPTELRGGSDGLNNFIEMFFNWLFINTDTIGKKEIIKEVNKMLTPELFKNDIWIADYRRIRILATRKH
jgi:trans-aconitate methyltransferase